MKYIRIWQKSRMSDLERMSPSRVLSSREKELSEVFSTHWKRMSLIYLYFERTDLKYDSEISKC
jgi:hypothetical protein